MALSEILFWDQLLIWVFLFQFPFNNPFNI